MTVSVYVDGHPVAKISSKYECNVSNICSILSDVLDNVGFYLSTESKDDICFADEGED